MVSRLFGVAAFIFLSTLLATGAAMAEGKESEGGHAMHGVSQLDAGAGKKGCKHGKGKQGMHEGKKGHGGCKKHGAKSGASASDKHLYGANWKQSLTNDQKAELDRLHLQYARIKAPLKAGIKALEVQLAVLATSGDSNPKAIDGPLMDLVLAKQEMLRAKYKYISAQRQMLTPQQQVSFDMEVIHKAMHGKKDKEKKGGHGKH